MNKKYITDELAERVFKEFSENSYLRLLIEIDPDRKYEEIAKHIKKNLNKYLTDAEQEQMVHELSSSFTKVENEEKILNVAIYLAAIDVKKSIDSKLMKNEVISHQYDSSINYKQYELTKYLEEENRLSKIQNEDNDDDYSDLPF